MFGINGGYDSRPMNTGGTDTGINVSGTEKSAFFQQVAVNAEAVSNDWDFNAYALIPVGDTEQDLNWFYQGGALNTYGLDVGYFITPELNASVGYYYQHGDLGSADGSGVLGRLAYEMTYGVTVGVNLSYDEAFETRVSADIKVRFGGASTSTKRKEVQQLTVINALTSTPSSRDVRVHDNGDGWCKRWMHKADIQHVSETGSVNSCIGDRFYGCIDDGVAQRCVDGGRWSDVQKMVFSLMQGELDAIRDYLENS